MKRRDFLAASAGFAATAAATPAWPFDETIPDYGLPEEMQPQLIRVQRGLAPYEVHVSPSRFTLFLTQPEDMAIRYTVGIGLPGLYQSGEFFVGAKKPWPAWTPTDEMIERDPAHYARWKDGMPGGPENPLGSRALYLFKPGIGDTFLRIHGTNDPRTIGKRVSNGCARLVNDQMIHLYNRVPMEARVVLYAPSEALQSG